MSKKTLPQHLPENQVGREAADQLQLMADEIAQLREALLHIVDICYPQAEGAFVRMAEVRDVGNATLSGRYLQ